MALSITQIIALRAPDFASDTRLNDMIELSELVTSQAFGDRRNWAVALRTMHMLALDAIQGGSATSGGTAFAGSVNSEKEGDLSRGFGNYSNSDADKYGNLATTSYGTELILLMKETIILPRTSYMGQQDES